MLRVVIVDDEYFALQGLKMELEEFENIKVIAMYENGMDMLAEINNIKADIIFLDIEMPGINGLELFEHILELEITPYIIFVTAYDKYAVKAFEINAFDYLVKPITKRRLKKSLDRIDTYISKEIESRISINCFKNFSIMVEGKDVNSKWRTRKSEELIAFLISEKGKWVSKNRLAEKLWPDLNQKKAMANLYTAYYYIKKLEKKKKYKLPIESTRGKMRIDIEKIECDIIEFEKMLEAAINMNSITDVISLERAIEKYKGSFLEDEYYDWARPIQMYYEIKAEKAFELLVKYYENKKEIEKADYYKKRKTYLVSE